MLAIESKTNHTLQYQIPTTSDCKDIGIRKIQVETISLTFGENFRMEYP